jgi:hypothetical protein
MCILLFALAVFFLLQNRTPGFPMFITLAVVLVLFAIAEAIIDVWLAALMSDIMQGALNGRTPEELLAIESKWANLYLARAAMAVTNKCVFRPVEYLKIGDLFRLRPQCYYRRPLCALSRCTFFS